MIVALALHCSVFRTHRLITKLLNPVGRLNLNLAITHIFLIGFTCTFKEYLCLNFNML